MPKPDTATIEIGIIAEATVGGKRLGRHLVHDARSLAHDAMQVLFGVTDSTKLPPLPTIALEHVRHVPPWDQGNIGDCTGNAICGAMMTDPLYGKLGLVEADAVSVYSDATHIDHLGTPYLPFDRGSSGLAVCKVAKNRGWISRYAHAFSPLSALHSIAAGPVITGINWYDSFDGAKDGLLEISPNAGVRGGHEIEVNRFDPTTRRIGGPNSWGVDWGDHGYWWMGWDTFQRLLSEGGDVTVPVR